MLPTSLLPRRQPRGSLLALAGAALLAGCEPDQPFSPSTDRIPATPSLAKAPKGGSLIITVVDGSGAGLTVLGSKFGLTRSADLQLSTVDNGPDDASSAIGVIQFTGLVSGPYTVCQIEVATAFLLPEPNCQTVAVGKGKAAQLTFVNLAEPRAKWVVRDGLTWASIADAYFTIDAGSGPVMMKDNMGIDIDPAVGAIEVKTKAGDVTICPVSVPAGLAFGLPAKGCVTKNVAGTTNFGPWNVYSEYNVYWWAMVGNAAATGGTYSITALGGGFSTTVTNDDASDRYPGSWMYVALPAGGWYDVCQTVAPTGAQLAVPSCKQVLVEYGISNFVPAFESNPL
ncbi:MAG TPA: hypothetical protein VFZ21_21765 [Gemmatimonadaceae bacterium]|nr:hypothetical protein [Gemmatimonadaceae bacterium]